MKPESGQVADNGGTKLGTFAGVFTPSILTILGIILFLRLGYVVGNAGLGGALVIIGFATLVSGLTSISLAAISTNIEVKGGGDYYLISRTLGAEFGGAIGIVLFLAQSVSVAFYAIGFAEAVVSVVGVEQTWAVQVIALIAVGGLFVLSWAGADVATRFQFAIMVALIAALVSFYLGAVGSFSGSSAGAGLAPPPEAIGFWVLFGIFFPAVTGFTQGVSMSGDLENPGRSLPKGTFLAVSLSTVVYVTVAILLAGTTEQSVLMNDTGQAMIMTALVGPLIVVGVVAATLSSAMASFLGAPRILQSLASDKIFPVLTPFAKGAGQTSNPRRAVLLTLAIAVATIGLGSLNVIAPVVSMFFLISYGLLNYATYYEAAAKSPSFRPRFKYFSKWLSLAGALACVAAMLAVNAVAGVVSGAILYALYRYVASKKAPDRWADASSSHYFQRAIESIAALSSEIEHPRNWRPQIISFSADPVRRARLLRFAKWLEGDSGLTATFQIVQGEGIQKRRELADQAKALEDQISELDLDVYNRLILAVDALEAVPVIVQAFGLGKLEANTVLFGWPETTEPDRYVAYVEALRDLARLGKNVVALSSDARRWETLELVEVKQRRIDVIWTDNDTGRLAVLAAYLCTRTSFWQGARIRVLDASRPDNGEGRVAASDLEQLLYDARISAEVIAMPADTQAALVDVCRDASMIFIPMRIRDGELLDWNGRALGPIVASLPMTAAMLAGTPMHLVAQPDSGPAAALANAEEEAEEARRRLSILEKRLVEVEAKLEEVTNRDPLEDDYGVQVAAEERRLDEALRRTLKARVRVESADARVDELVSLQR